MLKNISFKDTKYDKFENLNYIYISQFNLTEYDYVIDFTRLYIYYIELKGNFTFDNGDFIEFNAYLKEDGYMELDAFLGLKTNFVPLKLNYLIQNIKMLM